MCGMCGIKRRLLARRPSRRLSNIKALWAASVEPSAASPIKPKQRKGNELPSVKLPALGLQPQMFHVRRAFSRRLPQGALLLGFLSHPQLDPSLYR